MRLFLGIVLVVILFAATIYWKVGVWNECRLTNSFGYCFQLINR